MELKNYLNSIPLSERDAFGERCGTSFAYLRQIAYRNRPCSIDMAMTLERESRGVLHCEYLCPNADWGILKQAVARLSAPDST